jgi:alpha-tubulin suppressor-like RCC1 family protein
MFKSWVHTPALVDTVEEVFSVTSDSNASVLFISAQNNSLSSVTVEVFVSISGTDYRVYASELKAVGSSEGPSSARVATKIIVPVSGSLKIKSTSTDVDFLFSGEEYLVDENAYFGGVFFMNTNEVLGSGPAAVPGAEIFDDRLKLLHLIMPDGYYISAPFEHCIINAQDTVAVSAGGWQTVGLKPDGTCVVTGTTIYLTGVTDWTDIVAIVSGDKHTIGLKSDGTCVATSYNPDYISGVTNWTDIVAISAGNVQTVGLKSDGTCVATGSYISGVTGWTDIVAIAAGGSHTVGLKSDGTCVVTGNSDYIEGVTDWTDIVAIAAGGSHTVGLKSDGTCVVTGNSDYIEGVTDWTDIVAIAAGGSHTVGLKSDGTCVATSHYLDNISGVTNWTDIVAISAGGSHTVGLKSDGTCVATGSYNNIEGVTGWTLINVDRPTLP